MTPFQSCKTIVMVEIADHYAQVKRAFNRVEDQRCAWESKAIWNDGAGHVGADQPVDVSVCCDTFGGASKGVEEAELGHAEGILVCCYVCGVYIVDYLKK